MIGTVKKFYRARGFGFVVTDAGTSFFFHSSGVVRGGFEKKPAEGDRISFDVEHGDRGPRAVNIARA